MATKKNSRVQGAAALVLGDGFDTPQQVIESSVDVLRCLAAVDAKNLSDRAEMGLFRMLNLVADGLQEAEGLLQRKEVVRGQADTR